MLVGIFSCILGLFDTFAYLIKYLSVAKIENASLESRCCAHEKDLASARALVLEAQRGALQSASAQALANSEKHSL
jgi:hypothetical protein